MWNALIFTTRRDKASSEKRVRRTDTFCSCPSCHLVTRIRASFAARIYLCWSHELRTSRSRRLIDLRGLATAQKVVRAVRRNAINSAKISKNYAMVRGSAFNFAKARKDLSRFGNWHASWIRVELVKGSKKCGNGVAIESTGGLVNTNIIVMGIVKKILVFTKYSRIAKINRDNP